MMSVDLKNRNYRGYVVGPAPWSPAVSRKGEGGNQVIYLLPYEKRPHFDDHEQARQYLLDHQHELIMLTEELFRELKGC